MVRGITVRLIVLIAVPMSFFNPFSGVLWYLWYSHFRPNDFIWPQYAFKTGALLIASATLLGYTIFEMQYSPPRWRGLILAALFWIWVALATVFANDHSLALGKLSEYTKILVMTFLVAAVATTEDRIRIMITAMGASIGLLGARATAEFLLTGAQNKVVGVGGVELEGNEFALALNLGFSILVGLSYVVSQRAARYGTRIMALFCAAAVVGTFSRSGFLGLASSVLLFAWYSPRRLLNLGALCVVVIAVLPLLPQRALTRYQSIPTAAELDPSAIARIQSWETGLQMIKAHPLFGVGPLNFQSQYSHYFLQKYMDAANYHPRAPHNAYVCLAAESGIPSMLLFIAFVGATIVRMGRIRRRLLQWPGTERLAGYCLTIQITLMVYLIPNFFISRQNEDLMWHLVGISTGLALLAESQLAAKDSIEDVPAPVMTNPVLAGT